MNAGSECKDNNEDLYQIALFIDQVFDCYFNCHFYYSYTHIILKLKHDDVSLRINASNNLDKIARAIGAERTKDEVIL